jgi:hypothetical protein
MTQRNYGKKKRRIFYGCFEKDIVHSHLPTLLFLPFTTTATTVTTTFYFNNNRALLNFLDEKKFPDAEDFMEDCGEVTDAEGLGKLHDILGPYMLRRMKEDVEKSLVAKQEMIIQVELTSEQKRLYRAVYEKNVSQIAKLAGARNGEGQLKNIAMQLRKCCNHPFLINGIEETTTAAAVENAKEGEDPMSTDAVYGRLIAASGKLVLLDKLLPKLRSDGHRVLIFSQFVMVLDILNDYFMYRGFNFERIDGAVHGKERQLAIDRFCAPDSNAFIFMLSTRAGGVGINLTAADRVIIFDSDWNPQNDVQAMARCHRIGQKKQVTVFRLITTKTYEAQMFERASLKLGLDQAVLHGMTSNISRKEKDLQPTREELNEMLKYGAYDLFKEEREGTSEANAKKFGEEDIDSILQKAVVIQHESKQTSGLSSKFSVATFASNNADSEVDVEDPEFWAKTVGLAAMAASKKKNTISNSPLKTRRGKYDNKNYSETSLANRQWVDSEGEDDAYQSMQPRFSKLAVFNILKVLWKFGLGERTPMKAKDILPESQTRGKSKEDVYALMKAFVAMVAIAHVAMNDESIAEEDESTRVVSSKWLAPG